MNHAELERIARGMVAPGKGILAADESTGTITKRFDAIALESTAANRQLYREMLLAAPGLNEAISGVILYDETLRQSTRAGVPFPQHLASLGIFPGIKVDQGAKPLANFPNETVTEGLDGLRERLAEYHGLGARFAKWRAVIDIGAGYPTRFCIEANAHALARYAALCQAQGIVPIVEPEVLMDGAHSLETCEAVTDEVLCETFRALAAHRADDVQRPRRALIEAALDREGALVRVVGNFQMHARSGLGQDERFADFEVLDLHRLIGMPQGRGGQGHF